MNGFLGNVLSNLVANWLAVLFTTAAVAALGILGYANWPWSAAELENSTTIAVRVVTIANEGFSLRGELAASPEKFPGGISTRLMKPRVTVHATRYPGPSYDEKGILRDPEQYSEWFLKGFLEFEGVGAGGPVGTLRWFEANELEPIPDECPALNCKFKLAFHIVANPLAKTNGEGSCLAPEDCHLLLIKMSYSTLDKEKPTCNPFS